MYTNFSGGGIIVELEEEYMRNRTAMKKIKNQDTQCFIVYALNLIIILFMVFSFIMTGKYLYLIISSIVICTTVTGFFSVYKKSPALAIISASLMTAEIVLLFMDWGFSLIPLFGFVVFIYCAVINVINCKKYEWLSQQDGFPNFEIKQKMYEMEKAQWAIKDPYTQEMEEIKKRNSDSDGMESL